MIGLNGQVIFGTGLVETRAENPHNSGIFGKGELFNSQRRYIRLFADDERYGSQLSGQWFSVTDYPFRKARNATLSVTLQTPASRFRSKSVESPDAKLFAYDLNDFRCWRLNVFKRVI